MRIGYDSNTIKGLDSLVRSLTKIKESMIITRQDLMYVKKLKTIADRAKDRKPIEKSIFREIEKRLPINEN